MAAIFLGLNVLMSLNWNRANGKIASVPVTYLGDVGKTNHCRRTYQVIEHIPLLHELTVNNG